MQKKVFSDKKFFIVAWLLLTGTLVSSCIMSPIRKDYLEQGIRNVSMPELQKDPGPYMHKLFLLGGVIASTQVTDEGTLIYAVYTPVDPEGNPERWKATGGRYIALYPRTYGTLDPLIYKKNLEITVAGEFMGLRKGRLDEASYDYPVFRIEQIYLWKAEQYRPAPSYYPYYGPYYYSPYNYPYPYYPYYNYPYYYPGPYWPR